MRYHVMAVFKEEQRKGFITTHMTDFETDSNEEVNERVTKFLLSYNHNYCHGLDFCVREKKEE